MPMEQLPEILRCPETKQKVSVAPPELVRSVREAQAAGRLFQASGKPVAAQMEAGLVREDGRLLYPVVDGIPVMLKEEAIIIVRI